MQLANPNFVAAQKIDLLLGASAYAEIVMNALIKGEENEPIAQQTKLGWIVFGPAEIDHEYANLCHALQQRKRDDPDDNLPQAIQRFWETEEIELERHLTADEHAAESIFVNSLQRSSDCKFIVDLPFKTDPRSRCLGESREQAERRLRASQRRFAKNPDLKSKYDQNIAEYLELGPELFDLLIQWRRFRYAFCGDIEKMYRQVWVNPDHALYPCILWQPPASTEVKTYKLLTVTFGTASAPFQAIRAIDEIGQRAFETNAELGNAIRKCFYVDDFLGTADTIATAISLREQLTEESGKYGFNLRK